MKRKDHVIAATDQILIALGALVRIDYDNDQQARNNLNGAIAALHYAAASLVDATLKKENS